MVLCDLMRVLASSWHLYGSAPVAVHEALSVSQVLDVKLGEIRRLVQAHVVVGRSGASLGSTLRHQEEVEALVVLLVLNQVGVDDAARRRVLHPVAMLVLDEDPLVDALVHNNQSDRRNA